MLAVLVLCLLAGGRAVADDDREPLTIGWAAWASNEITTRIVARVLREHAGVEVELVNLDVAPMYRGLAAGEIDIVLAGWQPTAHARYIEPLRDRIVDLGILYDHARMGWVVPDYVPADRVRAIDDLRDPAVRERLRGRIVGIEPGAGMTPLSRRAMEVYELGGYELQVASGRAMTVQLEQAIDAREWIVVNGWTPHWIWSEWDLRYLEDPRGVFGAHERVHVLARPRFVRDRPEAAAVLARIWFPLADLQAALARARETSFAAAAEAYVADNPGRVRYWLNGGMPGD
mgnify:CR=1 FL=1